MYIVLLISVLYIYYLLFTIERETDKYKKEIRKLTDRLDGDVFSLKQDVKFLQYDVNALSKKVVAREINIIDIDFSPNVRDRLENKYFIETSDILKRGDIFKHKGYYFETMDFIGYDSKDKVFKYTCKVVVPL